MAGNSDLSSLFQSISDLEYTAPEERMLDEAEKNLPPVVFLCLKCNTPLGDSLGWVGNLGDDHILLKRATENVCVSEEHYVSGTPDERGCLIAKLTCRSCCCHLGKIFVSTPKCFDYKRFLYCLKCENIESYTVDSGTEKLCRDEEDEPVTLEYKMALRNEIEKVKSVILTLEQKISELESKFQKDL
ncbi:MS18A protein, partial [Atractosteus spatula]|nr:MS18A protein [Atractosteus spatula]